MQLIGISGKRGSGKDLLSSFLETKYGFLKLPFAQSLKEEVREKFGLTREHTDGSKKEFDTEFTKLDGVNYWTPRQIMIEYGKFFRQFDSLWWVKRTFDKIDQLRYYKNDQDVRIVISDVRFKNEANFIKEQGGILVRLERDANLNIYKGNIDDISEMDLDDYKQFDFRLDKEHNLVPDDLEKFAEDVMVSTYIKGF